MGRKVTFDEKRQIVRWTIEHNNNYKAAAEKGNKYAQHNIAFCYWDGMGVEKNNDLAIMWMRRSAEQGYEKAYKALEMMEGK